MKSTYLASMLAACALSAVSPARGAEGWPSQHEGVMLQGFYWDSFADSKWTNLEAQAEELSDYFNLIWIPNSGYCGAYKNMGYMPQYWFSNHNSSFGSEAELRSMISTFREKGTGFIADVVINHRNGVTNWYDFPAEEWNGRTWSIGLDGICCNDEMAYAAGQPKPTGGYDTGDNFDGCRDLDHTNANVQNNCKNYCKFLLDELGYVGFRYDMVKGYGGEYNKIYNNYSNPTYSVGEYWDGQYDAVKGWIEATGRTSAAFDFPFKYALNEAFSTGDLSKLVWKANGTTDQPAGMIHFGYPRYAVTFVDNHDTYRDGSKFTGNVLAANAFMLSCPGTPCVFLQHWLDNKEAIKPMIAARLEAGVHNESAVKVLRTGRNVYMAEVTGKYGTMVVKIGSEMISPEGYASDDIRAFGNDYCIWVKSNGSGPVDPIEPDDPIDPTLEMTLYFDNSGTGWATPYIYYWPVSSPEYPGVAMKVYDGDIWSYTVPAGTTGVLFNAGDGDASKTEDFAPKPDYVYTRTGAQGNISDYQGGGHGGNFPAEMYLIGSLDGAAWSTSAPQAADKVENGVYTWNKVVLVASATDNYSYFSFVTAKGADWNVVNSSDRYGAATADAPVSPNEVARVVKFAAGVNASSAFSWQVAPSTYSVTLDLNDNVLRISDTTTGVTSVAALDEVPRWFSLMGEPVAEPQVGGVYIRVAGGKAEKVLVR